MLHLVHGEDQKTILSFPSPTNSDSEEVEDKKPLADPNVAFQPISTLEATWIPNCQQPATRRTLRTIIGVSTKLVFWAGHMHST